ncbi:MarR family winged helix-turn-helix transcriptional regulator [Kitasatospora sp. NPDC088391]|uniref:MarR family winged helix-turn-helix transcriptional regulator n=1 Tax=Kitasatospora sp. NPDC088391 TaxID=3364074 RepID=UPI003817A03A
MMKDVHNSGTAEDPNGHLYDPALRTSLHAFARGGDILPLEAAAAVRSAAQALDRLRSHGAGGRGLSAGALDILTRLATAEDRDRGLSVGELARAAGVSSRNVTGLVDTLERDHLVRRAQDPDDRRSVRVLLTVEGEAWLDAFRQPTQRAMSAVFRGFTPEELAAFRHLCLRLVANQHLIEQHLNAGR